MGKTIYLHIGCGKTGSSALQNWLRDNVRALAREGVHYPQSLRGNANRWKLRAQGVDADYAITSGNGMGLVNAVKAGNTARHLRRCLRARCPAVLFSSEAFQSLTEVQVESLREAAESAGHRIVVIAYVRDLYEILYSSYLQLVKRHGFTRSFREFALDIKEPQQLRVVERFEQHVADVRLIHYDSAWTHGIEQALLQTLGLGNANVPAMSAKTVNRSLSVMEAELMLAANRAYTGGDAKTRARFSTRLSDSLIYGDPERESELFVDPEVIATLRERFGDQVEALNQRHFGDQRLQIYSAGDRRTVDETPTIDPAYASILQQVVGLANGFSFEPKASSAPATASDNQALATNDPRLVNYLRDTAVAREQTAPREAFVLMAAAAILRPGGQFIANKLKRYGKRFRIAEVPGSQLWPSLKAKARKVTRS